MSDVRVDRVVTSGTFSLDGGTWDVDNNIWLIGDDTEVVIVDAAHTAQPIIDAVAGRRVKAIVLTHGHNDHVTVAPELSERLDAPILLHPADDVLWRMTHPDVAHLPLEDGQRIAVAGTEIQAIHTPGHSPGSTCLYLPEAGELFSGDTLFSGGPGATGRSFSDFPTIIGSIRDRLFALPAETRVHTGHGDGTTIGTESPHLEEWIRAGS
ncbi:MBL fold metallo-hydrolase [Rhodococcus oryzae]|uniref:MBL fold metallo-hydrolase n=1 Tax=Rhodococcus oryzae TaxID=2571143 RepID=A0ABY2RP15_9NOCA|nr:MBL fold metallo-hydrolase [Rhodococcus oryzae]TJZ80224.1 MBL fold metallo-hydrolase [Rhodococcus oryzae]